MTLEGFLARLYSDPEETAQFLGERERYVRAVGLPKEHWQDVFAIDAAALRFAVFSYECKRRERR